MIAPDRRRRAQDLADVVARLESYRDQPEDFDLDRVLDRVATDGRAAVLEHLRDRLFDASRRNPLLHFRPTGRTLNLTEASVPLVLDVRHIRASQLFTWGGPASSRLLDGKVLDVGSLVRWDDAPYAAAALDALISSARRDRAEYGRDQLRLVVGVPALARREERPDRAHRVAAGAGAGDADQAARRARRVPAGADQHGRRGQPRAAPPAGRAVRAAAAGDDRPGRRRCDRGAARRASRSRRARRSRPWWSASSTSRASSWSGTARRCALQAYRRRRPSSRARRSAAASTRTPTAGPGWAPLGVQIYRRPDPAAADPAVGRAGRRRRRRSTWSRRSRCRRRPTTTRTRGTST